MTLKISFTSVKPNIQPSPPVHGRFHLQAAPGETAGSLLTRFGLASAGMMVLKNGIHADFNDPVADGDLIDYLLVVAGG